MKNLSIFRKEYLCLIKHPVKQKEISSASKHRKSKDAFIPKCIFYAFTIFFCFFLSLPTQTFAQCISGCNQSVTTNVLPGTNNFSNTFCISTVSSLVYSQNFDMNGGTTCVGPNVTFNSSGGNWNGNWTVNNYGSFSKGITLNSGQVFNNYGTFTGSVTLNGGTIVNYNAASFSPTSFTFNSGSFTNNAGGTATLGSAITLNSGSTFVNNGSLSVPGLTLNSSSSATLGGSTTINGSVTNNGTIAISGLITITGNYNQNSSGILNSQSGSQCNTLNVTGTIQGQGTYNGLNGLLLSHALSPSCSLCLTNGTSTSPAGQPANQVAGPLLTTAANNINGTIVNPGGSPAATNYIVLRRYGIIVSDQPTNYINYSVGAVIGNSVVVAVNPITTLNFTDNNVITANGCGTYYYAAFPYNASANCGTYNRTINASNRSSIAITSAGGSVTTSTAVCSGSTSGLLTLSGYTGSVVRWESAVSPFSSWSPITNTTNTYTSSALTQTTQFRAVINAGTGCSNVNSTAATITVNPLPPAPSGTGVNRCGSGSVTLTATPGSGETIDWYAAASGGGALLSGSNTYTLSLSTTTTFYAEARKTATGCVSSSRTAVTGTINSLPAAPTGTNNSRCGNGTVTISATPGAGETIDWYAAASGGVALLTGNNSYTTTSLSSTTIFYAEARNTTSGCVSSSRTAVTATINPIPSLTLTGTTSICSGTSSIVLTYSSPVNSPDQYSIDWGSAGNAAGMTDLGFTSLSGGTITLGGITGTAGNYPVDIYVRNSATGCQSAVTSGTVCSMVAENTTLSLSVPNGSTFTGINFASYGTPTGSCGSFTTSSCHAVNSASLVQAAALGQSSFSIAASNAVFGDPCVGTVKNLYVEAAYGFAISISPALTASITGTTTICSGSSTTLTAPTAPHYLWSTGDTTQSITVSPTTNTTYSVTISNVACTSSASKLVTVNPIPSVILSNNSPAVCSGVTSTILNYSSPVNSPDQYSIVWSAAGNAAGLSNVTLAPLSGGVINLTGITSTAGTYAATITIANSATGCSSSISTGSMCNTVTEGGTLSMTAPAGAKFIGINFASYGTPTGSCGSFAIGGCHASNSVSLLQAAAIGNTTFAIGANNGVFGDPCSGTVKRLYVDASYSVFALTVNAIPAAPTAGSNSPVCSGNTINLTASTITGATYSWTGPSGYTSTSQNPSITSAVIGMSGTYSVRSTVAGCNSVSTGNTTVVVNGAPFASISYGGAPYCSSISSAQPVSFTGTTGGTFSAPAALNINSSTGAINPSLSTIGGPYTVTYTVAASGGCSIYTTTTTVTIVGIPTATIVSGAGTFCATKTITASGGTGGTIYFQGTTSGGTSTTTASTSQAVTTSGTYYFRSRNASGCWGTEGSVVVVIKPTPTASAASLSSNYCAGSSATINLTGLVPASVNTINYSINGVAQTPVAGVTANGSGNASFSTGTLTIANNGQTLQVTGINNGTCTTTVALGVILVVNPVNTWLGFNTNWNDPINWCGTVPAGTANVIFPTGVAFYPVISSGTIQANNLTIANGASVTVVNSTLKISGTITNNGTLTASNGTMEFNGTSASQTIAGSMFAAKTIQNLKISNTNGVSLSGTNDTLKISGLISYGTSNSILTTNGNLTLLSSAAGNASVADMTNAGANVGNNIIGNVTVEHYIPVHSKAWQFLAVPTNGQTIKDAWQEGNSPLANTHPGYGAIITSNVAGAVGLGFDIYTASSPSMKTYVPLTASWAGVASPALQIANKKGYMLFVRGDRSVTAYNQAATSTILRTTGQLYTIGLNAPPTTIILPGKLESVGNPYASAIDFTAITKIGSVDSKFYVWDPLLTNTYNGYGGYQCISATSGWKPVPGGTANYDATVVCKTIQSGQAFFVYSSGLGGTVSFTESCKVNGSLNVNRPSNVNSGRQFLRLNLYNSNDILSDGNIVAFDQGFSNEYDEDDALKITNTSENIGIKRGDSVLSVEARSLVATEDTVFYNLGNMKLQSYQLRFYPENMSSGGLTALLVDKFLNSTTPVSLSDSTVVNFGITTNAASYAPDRFYVIFKQQVVLPVTIAKISAAYKQKDIYVSWKVASETSMKQYEVEHSINGHEFTKINTTLPSMNNGGGTEYSFLHLSPPTTDNFYRIKALSLSGLIQYSSIVKVSPGQVNSGISIYPNPVTGNTIQVQFIGQPVGKYNISLVHSNGSEQQLSVIELSQLQSTESIMLPQLLANGTYYLRITGPDQNSILRPVHIAN